MKKHEINYYEYDDIIFFSDFCTHYDTFEHFFQRLRLNQKRNTKNHRVLYREIQSRYKKKRN